MDDSNDLKFENMNFDDRGSNAWSRKDRCAFHLKVEKFIFQRLSQELPGKLERASEIVDKYEKVDWFWNDALCAIKTRQMNSGPDLLIDVYEPFSGFLSDENVLARDMQKAYAAIAHLENTKTTLSVVCGLEVHSIIKNIIQENEEKISDGEISNSHEPKRVFSSDIHSDCHFKVVIDAYSNKKKLVAILPISYLTIIKQIPLNPNT